MELVAELFRFRRYKNNQGRLVRRLTMVGIWLVFAVAAYKTSLMAFAGIPLLQDPGGAYIGAGVIALFGLWFGFRVVNWSTFADFMIAVESEMVKVSYPGNPELYSSTIVVLSVFALLAALIYTFDILWVFIFKSTGLV